MRCLVTGAAGFLGSHMVERLKAEGHWVAAADVYRPELCDNFFPWDVRERFRMPSFFGGLDWIFHFAGLAAIPPSLERPADYMAVNVLGTAHVLEAARKAGASRFIYAASGTCYGFNPPTPTPESARIEVETPYALSKWLGEEAVRHYDRVFDLPSVSLRLFNPYGPRMSPLTSGIGHFLKLRAEGKPATVTGDGTQFRDWHYVDDCIEAFLLAAKSMVRDEVFNIGSGNPQTLNRLVAELGFRQVAYMPARREAPGTWADISKAKRILGWEPLVSFEEGIRRTLAG